MEKICPKCLSGRLKTWVELSPDEKFVIEKMPPARGCSVDERKAHLFCTRCMFETGPFEEKA